MLISVSLDELVAVHLKWCQIRNAQGRGSQTVWVVTPPGGVTSNLKGGRNLCRGTYGEAACGGSAACWMAPVAAACKLPAAAAIQHLGLWYCRG